MQPEKAERSRGTGIERLVRAGEHGSQITALVADSQCSQAPRLVAEFIHQYFGLRR